VDRRFTLALAILVLVAGALALWLSPQAPPPAPDQAQSSQSDAPPPRNQPYVLAISWHPAFCEDRSGRTECRNEGPEDFAADNFVLHGLWPEDEYCGVDDRTIATDTAGRWDELPELDVTSATWRELTRVMPGTHEQLERHEWIFHGTCSGVDAETYFGRAMALLAAVNASEVRDLFARSIGTPVSRTNIRQAFDSAFGPGAGRKVRVDCDDVNGRMLITELRINLSGDVLGSDDLPSLFAAARNAGAGCQSGIIDEAG
jgi:ribonuclease T2